MSIRETVVAVFADVAKEQRKPIVPLIDHVPLLELGLDSLCMAIIVARLEDRLGADPFTNAADEMAIPVTFGEFVALYENALV